MLDQQSKAVPAIMFATWVATSVGWPKRLAPLLALVLGVASGIWMNPYEPAEGALLGVLNAAAAVGFHSGTKNSKQEIDAMLARRKNL